jgi:hypothetical protein
VRHLTVAPRWRELKGSEAGYSWQRWLAQEPGLAGLTARLGPMLSLCIRNPAPVPTTYKDGCCLFPSIRGPNSLRNRWPPSPSVALNLAQKPRANVRRQNNLSMFSKPAEAPAPRSKLFRADLTARMERMPPLAPFSLKERFGPFKNPADPRKRILYARKENARSVA